MKKQNPLTAMIFMIGILCCFVIATPVVLIQNSKPISLAYLAILLLMMAMGLLYVVLRGILRRIDALEEKNK